MERLKSNIEIHQTAGLTHEASVLSINFSNAIQLYRGNSVLIAHQVEHNEFKKFIKLRDQWKNETMFSSSGTEIISNGAYKKIIKIGVGAISWIIRDLDKTNDHWFYALEKITGNNPIKEENVGAVEKMKTDWVEWAIKHNYYV